MKNTADGSPKVAKLIRLVATEDEWRNIQLVCLAHNHKLPSGIMYLIGIALQDEGVRATKRKMLFSSKD